MAEGVNISWQYVQYLVDAVIYRPTQSTNSRSDRTSYTLRERHTQYTERGSHTHQRVGHTHLGSSSPESSSHREACCILHRHKPLRMW